MATGLGLPVRLHATAYHAFSREQQPLRSLPLLITLALPLNSPFCYKRKYAWNACTFTSGVHFSPTQIREGSKTATYPQIKQNRYPCTKTFLYQTKHRHCVVGICTALCNSGACHVDLLTMISMQLATTGLQTCMMASRLVRPSVEDPGIFAVVATYSRWAS